MRNAPHNRWGNGRNGWPIGPRRSSRLRNQGSSCVHAHSVQHKHCGAFESLTDKSIPEPSAAEPSIVGATPGWCSCLDCCGDRLAGGGSGDPQFMGVFPHQRGIKGNICLRSKDARARTFRKHCGECQVQLFAYERTAWTRILGVPTRLRDLPCHRHVLDWVPYPRIMARVPRCVHQ